MTLFEFFEQPNQMAFWSKPDHLIAFIRTQAYFHSIGSSPQVSQSAQILNDCADQLSKLYGIENVTQNQID